MRCTSSERVLAASVVRISVARVTVADARLHLDELVIVERTLELGDDGAD